MPFYPSFQVCSSFPQEIQENKMKWFLYFMSIYFIVAGATFILYTDWAKRLFQKMSSCFNFRWFSPLPLIIGVLFILSRDLTHHPCLILTLGILAMGKGIYLLLSPKKHIDTMINWWIIEVQDITYRFWGIIILILGITLFSWI